MDSNGIFTIDEGATGILVDQGNTVAMAAAITFLMGHESVRQQLGEHAVQDVRERFTLERHVEGYLHWYMDIVKGGQ